MKGFLGRQTQLVKHPTHRGFAESNSKLPVKGNAKHLGRPQGKREKELQGILPHRPEQPLHLGRRQYGGAAKQLLGAESVEPTGRICGKPFIDAAPGHAQRFDDHFRAAASKYKLHRSQTQLLKSLMTDFPAIKFCHTTSIHENPLCRHTYETVSKRPPTIDGMDVDEFIMNNADPIWLHQNEMWEYIVEDKRNEDLGDEFLDLTEGDISFEPSDEIDEIHQGVLPYFEDDDIPIISDDQSEDDQ